MVKGWCILVVLFLVLQLVENQTTHSLTWPSANNVLGFDLAPGDTLHFAWNDGKPHNVLQVYNWSGSQPPLSKYADAKFPNEIRSGDPVADSSYDWHVGVVRTGYRPGLYFFVDEGNAAGGIVSVGITYPESSNLFPSVPCSVLSDTSYYGGRYASYASRKNCTLYQVNNYQTSAHFDWVQPTFAMIQGDLIIFQWSDEHNIVQVHDVTQDTLVPGGITSGPKKNCVPGPTYSCINEDDSLGEYLYDSTNWRPGMVHISDECAYTCTGHTTGMNMQFFVQRPISQRPPNGLTSCCEIDPTKGTDCRVIEIYADEEGQQFNYNIPAGKMDLVRFRWAGSMKIYQSEDSNGSPTSTPLSGGYGMSSAVECIPGPNWSCLGGNTNQAQWVFDVNEAYGKGLYTKDQYYNIWFDFYGVGENTPGYTSQSSGTIIFLDNDIKYNPNRSAVACPASSTGSTSTATTSTHSSASSATTSATSSTSATHSTSATSATSATHSSSATSATSATQSTSATHSTSATSSTGTSSTSATHATSSTSTPSSSPTASTSPAQTPKPSTISTGTTGSTAADQVPSSSANSILVSTLVVFFVAIMHVSF